MNNLSLIKKQKVIQDRAGILTVQPLRSKCHKGSRRVKRPWGFNETIETRGPQCKETVFPEFDSGNLFGACHDIVDLPEHQMFRNVREGRTNFQRLARGYTKDDSIPYLSL